MSKKNLQLAFFITFTLGVLVLLFFILKPYLGVIFVSTVFAITFYPLYEWVTKKIKGRKNIAALVTTLLILIFVIIPIIFISTLLLREAIDLYNLLAFGGGSQSFVSQTDILIKKLNILFPFDVVSSEVDLSFYARSLLNWVIGHFDSIFVVVFGGVFNFIMILISIYYFLIYGSQIKKSLIAWSPLPNQYDEEFIETLRSSVDSVLRGRILVSIVQGVFIGLGFYIFGVGSPVLWGFIGGVASLVPALGTSIVTIPAVAYLFLNNNFSAGVGLLLWGAIAVGLIDNFISIVFLKNKIKVHPVIILFSILGGVEVFGAIGFLVGPVIVSACIALTKIYPFIMSFGNPVSESKN